MIWIEGNIISPELLEKLSEQNGQKPEDFGLKKSERLADEISRCWADAKDLWRIFKRRIENLPEEETGTTETRNIWMVPFLQNLLGYQLQLKQAEEVDGLSFAISHRDLELDSFPVHIIGCNQKLDKRYERQRQSAHALMQDYLNRTEHTYGIIANGNSIRLLRDSARLLKQQFVEWDLQRIIEEDRFTDFVLLFRLLHRTRMPQKREAASESILEQYHQTSIDEGNRIRDNLRNAVMKALENLGNGYISNAANTSLREQLTEGKISPENYSRLLRRVVYRLLFLMVAEERELIFPSIDDNTAASSIPADRVAVRKIYREHYSINRFRHLAEKMFLVDVQQQNIWQELLVSFSIFEEEAVSKNFGIGPLDGDLFNANAIGELNNSKLLNRDLLNALQLLNVFKNENGTTTRINYKLLDVEELGSVYESLLDLHPLIETINGTLHFRFVEGIERKTTGSYYTRSDLVQEIIKSALEPVVAERVKQERKVSVAKEKIGEVLLKLKICDPACGCGHFLLAAARCIARELSKLRSGDEQPTPTVYRQCLREVIQHCIYGVDMNPDAVELCKLALWLESHNSGKPLSFLDHKIRCGNSLVGVTDMNVLMKPLPDEAFNPLTGDDKNVCKELKKENAKFNKTKQGTLDFDQAEKMDTAAIAADYKALENQRQDDVEGVRQAQTKFEKLRSNHAWFNDWRACNLWTAAFFWNYTEANKQAAPNSERLAKFLSNPAAAYGPMAGKADALSVEHKFFHWPLEFPDVFELSAGTEQVRNGGFDVMLGNPPWERIKLQQQEFFTTRHAAIANAPNAAARNRLINKLPDTNPGLYQEYEHAVHTADATGKFLRESGRCTHTAVGDINTYSIFAELTSSLVNRKGRTGIIVPTGIATDDSNKAFFGAMVESNRLVSLFDFENREKIFQDVDSRYKFCLLTISASDIGQQKASFGFFLTNVEQLKDKLRIFSLSREDFLRLNPNTKTCPVFRTRVDAELTTKIYQRVPVLINEATGENPWGVSFMRMFDMSNDSHLFRTRQQLEATGFALWGNKMVRREQAANGEWRVVETWLPLYEAKMIWHYDHRFGSYAGVDSRTSTQTPTPALAEYQDPYYQILPWYWVEERKVKEVMGIGYVIGFRRITNNTNERTFVNTLIPKNGFGDNTFLMFSRENATYQGILSSLLSSLPFDFICRQKLAGMNMNFFYVNQFPILAPKAFNSSTRKFLTALIVELTYTSWDIKAFADDVWKEAGIMRNEELIMKNGEWGMKNEEWRMENEEWKMENEEWKMKNEEWGKLSALQAAIVQQWEENKAATGGHAWAPPEWHEDYGRTPGEVEGCPLPPFKWDEERRAVLKAELDAIYAKLYGLTTEELRYILDPQDVYGPDFPGETFRVLKEKEIRQYGEYRTRRLVLEAWERLK